MGDPRGYAPSVAGRGSMPRPRRGGRERSDRWKGETRSGFPLQVDWGCSNLRYPSRRQSQCFCQGGYRDGTRKATFLRAKMEIRAYGFSLFRGLNQWRITRVRAPLIQEQRSSATDVTSTPASLCCEFLFIFFSNKHRQRERRRLWAHDNSPPTTAVQRGARSVAG